MMVNEENRTLRQKSEVLISSNSRPITCSGEASRICWASASMSMETACHTSSHTSAANTRASA